MTRRLIGAIVIGIVGAALLFSLGLWQLQRLDWKRSIIAEIDARIAGDPIPLPSVPEEESHRFLPVEVSGRVGPEALRVVWTDDGGPAFRVVSPFRTQGRTILLDRGVIAADAPVPEPPDGEIRVSGNLHWPDEADAFTPPPEIEEGLWYARDVGAMAEILGAESLLVVARSVPGDMVSPRPTDTAGIRNDHLEYAITWFSLAAVWAGMTLALVWRIRRRIG